MELKLSTAVADATARGMHARAELDRQRVEADQEHDRRELDFSQEVLGGLSDRLFVAARESSDICKLVLVFGAIPLNRYNFAAAKGSTGVHRDHLLGAAWIVFEGASSRGLQPIIYRGAGGAEGVDTWVAIDMRELKVEHLAECYRNAIARGKQAREDDQRQAEAELSARDAATAETVLHSVPSLVSNAVAERSFQCLVMSCKGERNYDWANARDGNGRWLPGNAELLRGAAKVLFDKLVAGGLTPTVRDPLEHIDCNGGDYHIVLPMSVESASVAA